MSNNKEISQNVRDVKYAATSGTGDAYVYINYDKSDEDDDVKRYREAAKAIIFNSYQKSREIDPECMKKLEEDRKRFKLSPEQSEKINQEILLTCQNSDEDLEEYIKNAKEIIKSRFEITNDVRRELEVLRARYHMGEGEVGFMFTSLGSEFMQSMQDQRAIECFKEAINCYEGAKQNQKDVNAYLDAASVTYLNLATLMIKQSKKAEAIKLLKGLKKLYEYLLVSDQEVKELEKFIKQLERK